MFDISRENIERNKNYCLSHDGPYHEVYIAMVISDVMNVPIDWVDDEKMERISEIICESLENNKFYNENLVKKLMSIEKEIEKEKFKVKELER